MNIEKQISFISELTTASKSYRSRFILFSVSKSDSRPAHIDLTTQIMLGEA